MAAASIIGALTALTREVVTAGRVRTWSALPVLWFRFLVGR